MSNVQRVLIALAILLVDFAVFFVPITALVLAILIVSEPQILHRWTSKLVENV